MSYRRVTKQLSDTSAAITFGRMKLSKDALKIGAKVKHVRFNGAVREVIDVEPDGRYVLTTPDPSTRTGVRKTRVALKTLEREYEIAPE